MAVEFRIVDNNDDRFPGHILIEVVEDGRVTSRSWAPDHIPPEARLNLNHPIARDRRGGGNRAVRWALPDLELARELGMTDESYATFKAEAQKRGLDVARTVSRGPPPPRG